MQNILLSFKLLEETEGGADKASKVTQMVAYLVGKRDGLIVPSMPQTQGQRETRVPDSSAT